MTKINDRLIQRYLDNQLSDKEMSEFELRVKGDPALAKEIEELKSLDLAFESVGAETFRSELQSWESEREKPGKTISLRTILSIAASFIILITASILILQPAEYSNQELYAEYYVPYPNLITARDGAVDLTLEQGMEAYTAGNHGEAIRFLTTYLNDGGEDKGAKLYLAITLMQIDEDKLASAHLMEMLTDPLYGQQAQWYLGLLRLKNNDETQTVEIFQQISGEANHYRQQEAKEIIKKKGL
ncbi:MAG: hypothetical protein HKN76_06185 [Saprospiraceae bacterium]|nr:hypothetical protein [Saprospiraceae bacterium]